MGLFSQKKVWHSYLKHASPVVLKFKGQPVLSKYAEPGVDQYLAYFDVQGDDTEGYYYFVESEDVLRQLQTTTYGQWVRVSASGDSAENHYLDIQPAGEGDAVPVDQIRARSVQSVAKNQQPNYSSGFITEDYLKCVEEAVAIAGSDFMGTDDPSVIQSIAATLYINWSHTRFSIPLAPSDVEKVDVQDEEDHLGQGVLEALDKLQKRSGKAHDGRNLKTTIAKIEEQVEKGYDEDAFVQTIKWISAEVDHQTPEEQEELEDDLPF